MSRTVQPDGEKIKQLRLAKGWQVEELANEAGLSIGTVENIERGQPCFKVTLRRIAKSLEDNYQTLLVGAEPEPQRPIADIRITCDIILAAPYEEFDAAKQLVAFIKTLEERINAFLQIEVKDVKPGKSVIVTVEMASSDIVKLLKAWAKRELADLPIERFRFPEGVRVPVFDGRGQPQSDLRDYRADS